MWHTRLLIQADYTYVEEILNEEKIDFDPIKYLRGARHNQIDVVLDDNGIARALCAHRLYTTFCRINLLVVNPSYRRQGFGSHLLHHRERMLTSKRTFIRVSINEYNINAALFLRANGYQAKLIGSSYVFMKERFVNHV